jgi:DNA-binding LytR/AlgR family response regulator
MRKIAVIDSDKEIFDPLKMLLEEDGFLVEIATDGQAGISLVKEIMPDLILCDTVLDGMVGFEVYARILDDPKIKTIPFVFLTAKAEIEDLRKGLSMGADDYVFKPFIYKNLLGVINTRINKYESIKASVEQVSENLENSFCKKYNIEDKVLVNSANKPQLIKINEIKYICSENQYSCISMNDGKKIITRKSVSQWEEQLPENNFLRIHRSTIINLENVARIERMSSSSFLVFLAGEKPPFVVSKRYAVKIRNEFF